MTITKRMVMWLIATLLLCAGIPQMSARDFVLVLDAGHGGKDYGAVGRSANEKSINLAVAKAVGKMVEDAYGKDVRVVYTRDKDEFISLHERANRANRAQGDLFISIHVNSVDKKNKNRAHIEGSQVYTLGLHRSEDNQAVARRENEVMMLEADYSEHYAGFDPNSVESYIAFELNQSKHMDQSIEMADAIQRELTTTGRRADKGVRQAGFWVLWATSMPAVLVELDFICNPSSEQFLASKEGQKKLSTAIFNAFSSYLATYGPQITGRDYPKRNSTPTPDPAPEAAEDSPDSPSAHPEATPAEPQAAPQTAPEATQTAPAAAAPEDPNVPVYKVQILASSSKLKPTSPRFQGLSPVEMYEDGGLYKYTYGAASSEAEAGRLLRKVRKSFPEAFIIKMVGGKRVKD